MANPRDEAGQLLLDRLPHWARTRPDERAVTFVDHRSDADGTRRSLTWGELDLHVRASAAELAARTDPGDRVAVLSGNGLEYVIGFLAALHASTVAVPLFDPRLPGHADRLAAVLQDCRPRCVVTSAEAAGAVEDFLHGRGLRADGDPARRQILAVEAGRDPAQGAVPSDHPRRPGGGEVAYLQYTSGSTRAPTGVVITHRQVGANVDQLMTAYGLRQGRSQAVSWLPLFHDMGLVTALLTPLVAGLPSVLMDPMAFVQRPARWVRLLAEHPGAYAAAPNFAFDHCVRRIRRADRDAVRLDEVDVLINGSEPVRADTIERFHAAFGDRGLDRRAHRPSFGLAEATVFVTAAPGPPVTTWFDRDELAFGSAVPVSRDHPAATPLVSVGSGVGQRVLVVDPHTRTRCADGRVGEIWVNGPNIGVGYWDRPEATAETFRGVLADPAGDLPDRPWLRTGDLGVVHAGEVHVTGRIKDLVIIDGRNHYPHDIEETVEGTHPSIKKGRVAAFSVPAEEGERLVVVAEPARTQQAPTDAGQAGGAEATDAATVDPRALTTAVRREVAERHGIGLHDFLLLEAGTVPRTTSGKLARGACRQRYLAGKLAKTGDLA